MSWPGETIERFFALSEFNGRAVLRGDDTDPDVWLTRPDRRQSTYCLSFDNRDSIRMLAGDMLLTALADYLAKLSHVRQAAKRRRWGWAPMPRLDRVNTSRKLPRSRRRWGVRPEDLPYLVVAEALDPDQ